MKKLVEEWMAFADEDLSVAEALSDQTNAIAFHCQQAIEKYLKAFLIEYDAPCPKIHNLVRLNEMLKEIRDLGIDEDKLFVINSVYTNARYPGELGLMPTGAPTGEQVTEFIAFAKEVKTIIYGAL